MKPLVLLLFIVGLASCAGTTRPVEGSKISLETKEITRQDFFLMSVREHSLVVSPFNDEYFHIDMAISNSFVVPFDTVTHLEREGGPDMSLVAVGAGAGLVGGALIGNAFRPLTAEEQQTGTVGFEFTKETYLGMASGLVFGVVAMYLFTNKPSKVFYLDRPEDIEALHHIAIYHDEEPPELVRIR